MSNDASLRGGKHYLLMQLLENIVWVWCEGISIHEIGCNCSVIGLYVIGYI